MSATGLEPFLARLYVDAEARHRFIVDPRGCARAAGLAAADVDAVAALDPVGLELAARSFEAKRARSPDKGRGTWRGWLARRAALVLRWPARGRSRAHSGGDAGR